MRIEGKSRRSTHARVMPYVASSHLALVIANSLFANPHRASKIEQGQENRRSAIGPKSPATHTPREAGLVFQNLVCIYLQPTCARCQSPAYSGNSSILKSSRKHSDLIGMRKRYN
jgi:hypothetical protein